MPADVGLYGLSCWNALTPEQQRRLIEHGNLEIGTRAPGTAECDQGAEVGIETVDDTAPGPRFYCVSCAIKDLAGFIWHFRRNGPADVIIPLGEVWTSVDGHYQWRRRDDGYWEMRMTPR